MWLGYMIGMFGCSKLLIFPWRLAPQNISSLRLNGLARQESKKCGNDFNFIIEVEEFLPVLLTTALISLFLSVISCWSELQQHGGIDSELRL